MPFVMFIPTLVVAGTDGPRPVTVGFEPLKPRRMLDHMGASFNEFPVLSCRTPADAVVGESFHHTMRWFHFIASLLAIAIRVHCAAAAAAGYLNVAYFGNWYARDFSAAWIN